MFFAMQSKEKLFFLEFPIIFVVAVAIISYNDVVNASFFFMRHLYACVVESYVFP